jgi:hypothetical protein
MEGPPGLRLPAEWTPLAAVLGYAYQPGAAHVEDRAGDAQSREDRARLTQRPAVCVEFSCRQQDLGVHADEESHSGGGTSEKARNTLLPGTIVSRNTLRVVDESRA